MHPLLDLDRHPVIGHRGASGSAPENTLESFGLALDQGADGLELDLRLSANGVPLVVHDPTLERTTNRSGLISALPTSTIQSADAGYRYSPDGGETFPWRGRGVRVPSLLEVLERFPRTPLIIEVKLVEVIGPALRLLIDRAAADRTLIASFLEEALRPFRAAGFKTSGSRRGITRLWLRSLVGLPPGPTPDQAYAVPDRYKDRVRVASARFIRAARRGGCPVHVWTVNEAGRARELWALGASGMITNFPALLLAERNRLFPTENLGAP
jgi:glycerophosphoryl diester phosphodiesterase